MDFDLANNIPGWQPGPDQDPKICKILGCSQQSLPFPVAGLSLKAFAASKKAWDVALFRPTLQLWELVVCMPHQHQHGCKGLFHTSRLHR